MVIRCRIATEQGTGLGDRVGQHVHVGLVVVQVERRPGRRGHAHAAHQGLRTVVAGPDAHSRLIEDLGEVVGVDVAVRQ